MKCISMRLFFNSSEYVSVSSIDAFDNKDVRECCVDWGFSEILCVLAKVHSAGAAIGTAAKRRAEKLYLRSPRVIALLKTSAISQSCAIFDLELINALQRRVSNIGRPSSFASKSGKVYAHELSRAFEDTYKHAMPDLTAELHQLVQEEIHNSRSDTARAKQTKAPRGFDAFVRSNSADMREATNVDTQVGEIVPASSSGSNLRPGASDTHKLVCNIWRKSSWATKESWQDQAIRMHKSDMALAQIAKAEGGSSSSQPKAFGPLQSWQPPQQPLCGDSRSVITEREYVEEMQACSGGGKAAEKSWNTRFCRVIGIESVFGEAVGPQAQAAKEHADQLTRCQVAAGGGGDSADLRSPAQKSCLLRGDCERFGKRLLVIGDVITTHVCRFLQARAKVQMHGDDADGAAGNHEAHAKDKYTDKATNMLSVWELHVRDTPHGTDDPARVFRFVSMHVLYSPHRVILWVLLNVPGAAAAGACQCAHLSVTDDGLPDIKTLYEYLHSLPVTWLAARPN